MRSKKALKNIISSSILQLLTIICGFIIPRLIIKTYGSNVNGLINSIIQFLSYITLMEFGFGAVVKSVLYKPISQNNKSEIEKILKSTESFFKIIAICFVIYILLLCFIYPIFVNSSFDKFFTISLIIIIGISTFSEYFFGITYKLYLQAEQKNYVTSIINIITLLINTVIIVILINLKVSIQIVKLTSALIYVLRPIMHNVYVHKIEKISFKNTTEKFVLKQKWDGFAQHLAGVIHANTDVTLLTIFSNICEVSVYSIYNLVISAIKNFISILCESIDSAFGDMLAKNEKNNLNIKYSLYEFIYITIVTIVYSCTFVLIIPFVKIYTQGIHDVNYIRPQFAYLFCAASYAYSIKAPYNNLTYTAGKFKETNIGAWVEAFINVFLSLILIFKYGLIGIAIGTFISVSIRAVEFVIFVSKNILNRSVSKSMVKIFVSIFELCIVIFLGNRIIAINSLSYLNWIMIAIEMFCISLIIIIPINIIIFKKDFTGALNIIKNNFNRKKN